MVSSSGTTAYMTKVTMRQLAAPARKRAVDPRVKWQGSDDNESPTLSYCDANKTPCAKKQGENGCSRWSGNVKGRGSNETSRGYSLLVNCCPSTKQKQKQNKKRKLKIRVPIQEVLLELTSQTARNVRWMWCPLDHITANRPLQQPGTGDRDNDRPLE